MGVAPLLGSSAGMGRPPLRGVKWKVSWERAKRMRSSTSKKYAKSTAAHGGDAGSIAGSATAAVSATISRKYAALKKNTAVSATRICGKHEERGCSSNKKECRAVRPKGRRRVTRR